MAAETKQQGSEMNVLRRCKNQHIHRCRKITFFFTVSATVILFLMIAAAIVSPASALDSKIYDKDFTIKPNQPLQLPVEVNNSEKNMVNVGDSLTVDFRASLPADLLFFNESECEKYINNQNGRYWDISKLNITSATITLKAEEQGIIEIIVDHSIYPPGGASPPKNGTNLTGHLTITLHRDSGLGWFEDLFTADPNDPNFCYKQILILIISMIIFSLLIWLIKLPYTLWKKRREKKKMQEMQAQLGNAGSTAGEGVVSSSQSPSPKVLKDTVKMAYNSQIQYYMKTADGSFIPVEFIDTPRSAASPLPTSRTTEPVIPEVNKTPSTLSSSESNTNNTLKSTSFSSHTAPHSSTNTSLFSS
ncbi:MAG: hypothetical protein QW728_01620, partial [Thermoplasmata archaeon]